MRSTANQAANVAGNKITGMFNRHVWDHVLDIDEMIWWRSKEVDVNGNVVAPFKPGAIPIGLIAITAMWLLNLVFDWAGTNGGWRFISYPTFFASFVIGFGGYFAIWQQIAKPRNIGFGAFIFAAFSALQWKNPARGAATGVGTVLSLTGVIGLYYLFTALVLWTWGFSNSPMAFWVGIAAIIILASLGASAGIRALVMGLYTISVLIAALWSTFGDVYHGQAFNPNTGEPLYMVSQENGERDSQNRSPADCRPAGVDHKDFDYTKGNICFAESDGLPMVPMTKEQALTRNPSGVTHKAINGISNLSLPSISLGGSGPATASGNCTKGNPCVVYDGYVLHLTPNTPLVTNQAKAFWKTGMDVKVCNPKLRATMHDSELFNNEQPPNSNIVTVAPVASGFAKAGVPSIELRIYPRGEGDERIKRDCGVYTPPINLKPQ